MIRPAVEIGTIDHAWAAEQTGGIVPVCHACRGAALDELAAVSSCQGVESRWNYTLSRAEQLVAMADGAALRALVANFDDDDKLSDTGRTYLLNIRGHVAIWDGNFARAWLLFTEASRAGATELRHLASHALAHHSATLGWLQGDTAERRRSVRLQPGSTSRPSST